MICQMIREHKPSDAVFDRLRHSGTARRRNGRPRIYAPAETMCDGTVLLRKEDADFCISPYDVQHSAASV